MDNKKSGGRDFIGGQKRSGNSHWRTFSTKFSTLTGGQKEGVSLVVKKEGEGTLIGRPARKRKLSLIDKKGVGTVIGRHK